MAMTTEEISRLDDSAWECYWVKENYDKAFQMFLEVNRLDPTKGNYMLGMCYEFGDGVERDIEKAKGYYRCGAEIFKDAYINFNAEHLLSLEGDGVNRKHTSHWIHLKEASALVGEGAMLYDSEDVLFDESKGRELLEKAAAMGSGEACRVLGTSMLYLPTPLFEEGRRWSILGAQANISGAAGDLGFIYFSGTGVEEDFVEARYWFRKSALMGDVFSMEFLGFIYYNSGICEPNWAKAEFWYRRSQENGLAQYDQELMQIASEALQEIEKAKLSMTEEQKQQHLETQAHLQQKVDEFEKIMQQEEEAARLADIKEAEENLPPYNALLVRANGSVEKILLDFDSYSARKEAVDATSVDKILTARLSQFGQRHAGVDICGFCDGNGYFSGKLENEKIQWISGYDTIIGDVVLCACSNYDYHPLTPKQVDDLYNALR